MIDIYLSHNVIEVMLQFYDRLKSTSLLAIAAAGGALLAPTAIAATGCDISDGYAASLSAYVSEATTCLQSSDALSAEMADSVIDTINQERASAGLKPLVRNASLDQAAAAHALDMMSRRYANHTDMEGRDHVYRVRAFNRSQLIGATGANVLVAKPGANADDIFAKIKADSLNAENLVRDGFTDVGIAVAVSNGQPFIVQIFAAVEGELKQDLPLEVAQSTAIRADLTDGNREIIGWGLTDQASGDVIARGKAARLRAASFDGAQTANLDIVVTDQAATYILKGPAISAR